MGSGTFYSGAITDDGHRTATDYLTSNNNVWWGTSSYLGSFLRFQSVNIPQGATITSAKLHMMCASTVAAGTGSADIYAADADDQAAVPNYDEAAFDALPLTTEKANWPAEAFTSGSWYDSPDITDVIQEIVDRPGWVSGNHLALVIMDTDTSNAKRFYSYDYSSGANKPELIVTWAGETIERAVDAGQGLSGELIATRLRDQSAGIMGMTGIVLPIRLSMPAGGGMGIQGTASKAGTIFNSPAIEGGLGTSASAASIRLREEIEGGLGLEGDLATVRWRYRAFSGALGMAGVLEALNYSAWLREYGSRAIRRYRAVLTGAPDGVSDLTLPISSWQARMRQEMPTWLGVVVQGLAYAEEIAARSNGDLILIMSQWVDGVEALSEQLVEVDLDDVSIAEGGRNSSITLSGYRTVVYGTKITALSNVNYRGVTSGTYHLRCQPDLYIRPGDTARYLTDEFTIDWVTFYVGESQEVMEVQGQ